MPLALSDADRQTAVAVLKRYGDAAGLDLGDLGAMLLLDHVVQEIGPSIYNAALADAQRLLAARLADLDLDLGQVPFPSEARR